MKCMKNLRWKNLKSITNEGGKNICSKNTGLIAFVLKTVENDGGSFREFIEDMGENDLPHHIAVCWLSCEEVLQRFSKLRAQIEIFLNEKHHSHTELQNRAIDCKS